MTLSGQRVVVIGGTSGMGLATVRAAAAQGAEVIAAGRRSVAEREPIDGVLQAEVDVTDEASVRALFEGVGTLDHLFVSASPGAPGPFLEQDLAAARTFIDGKLLGSWTCARYAAPRMRAGGSITFVTGVAVIRPPGNAAMVTAAFAAIEALSRALALELGPLRVNTHPPGLHRQRDVVPAARRRARRSAPARRRGAAGRSHGHARGHRARRRVPDDEPPDHGSGARGQRRREPRRRLS